MNKYQEALDRIEINYCSSCENLDCQRDKLKKVHCDCPFQVDIDDLQELVDEEKSPTIEEVKKEWKEEGFEVVCSKESFEAYKQWIERHQKVSHHTSAKVVIEKDFFYIVGEFSNKYTQLLTKTFKALGRL